MKLLGDKSQKKKKMLGDRLIFDHNKGNIANTICTVVIGLQTAQKIFTNVASVAAGERVPNWWEEFLQIR